MSTACTEPCIGCGPLRVRGAAACRVMPAQVGEVVDDERQLARIEVAGVRPNVDVGLLAGDSDRAQAGRVGLVLVENAFGRRVLDMLAGDPLRRIC